MNKKFILTLFPSLLFLLFGCLSLDIERVENEVDEDYYERNFGNVDFMEIDTVSYDDLLDQIDLVRKGIIEDKDLSEDEKEKRIKEIKKVVDDYNDYQYLSFTFTSYTPYVSSEVAFKFGLIDGNDNSILEGIYDLSYKTNYYVNYVLVNTYYTYVWLLKSEQPITTKYFNEENSPIHMIIEFPNDQKRVYKIEPISVRD